MCIIEPMIANKGRVALLKCGSSADPMIRKRPSILVAVAPQIGGQ